MKTLHLTKDPACIFQTNLISIDGLSKFIDPSQLTVNLGGALKYDHSSWLNMRLVSTIRSQITNTASIIRYS
jgi:hypothetical protein